MKQLNIVIFLISCCGLHTLNAMEAHKETVQRLGDQLPADSKDEKEDEELNALHGSAIQKINQSIIDRKQAIKLGKFFAEFKSEAAKIWKDREKTETEIINKFVRKFTLPQLEKQLEENTHIIADGAQEAIKGHYVRQYGQLYKKLYLAHFNAEAPETVARYHAQCMYSKQQSSCCVIL